MGYTHSAARLTAILFTALVLVGCAGSPKSLEEPRIERVEVKVAVPVPCPALERLGPEPAYPDTDEAIAGAATIGQLAALYAKGRAMRVQRLSEYVIAKSSCIF